MVLSPSVGSNSSIGLPGVGPRPHQARAGRSVLIALVRGQGRWLIMDTDVGGGGGRLTLAIIGIIWESISNSLGSSCIYLSSVWFCVYSDVNMITVFSPNRCVEEP